MHRLIVAALLVPALAPVAPATTLRPRTTQQIVRAAARVCCVVCERCEPRLDRATGLVFTHVRFRLLEDLKGAGTGPTVDLRLAGGEAGGRKTVVPGMPTFRAGEECVLLLGPRNRAGVPVLMEAARGRMPLAKDRRGERRVRAFVTGFEGLKGPRVTLAAFREAVRADTAAAAKEAGK